MNPSVAYHTTYNLSNDTGLSTVQSGQNIFDVMMMMQSIIASVGILSNLIVVVVFLNHKKLRGKIPNILITSQVSPGGFLVN